MSITLITKRSFKRGITNTSRLIITFSLFITIGRTSTSRIYGKVIFLLFTLIFQIIEKPCNLPTINRLRLLTTLLAIWMVVCDFILNIADKHIDKERDKLRVAFGLTFVGWAVLIVIFFLFLALRQVPYYVRRKRRPDILFKDDGDM